MKTQIATTIEQSKKLLALGVSPESADMGYNGVVNRDIGRTRYDEYPTTMPNMDSIPAWSFLALTNLMPEQIDNHILVITKCMDVLGFSYLNELNHVLTIQDGNSSIEAAFNMICWLIEQGYIKTEKI